MRTIRWDQSIGILHLILREMRDCFISEYDGILTMKTGEKDYSAVVPLGWYITRTGEAQVKITQEKPVEPSE